MTTTEETDKSDYQIQWTAHVLVYFFLNKAIAEFSAMFK